MSTTKYTLIPRGPVRGIGINTTITDKCTIELNDFQALKVLLQGHSLLKGSKMDEVVKISDFVEDVDPQAVLEKVNLGPDYTAGCKRANTSRTKIVGVPRDFAPNTSEVDKTGKVDGQEAAKSKPEPIKPASDSTSSSESTSEDKKSDKASESTSTSTTQPSGQKSADAAKSSSETASTAPTQSETDKK